MLGWQITLITLAAAAIAVLLHQVRVRKTTPPPPESAVKPGPRDGHDRLRARSHNWADWMSW
jgi:hypothetical protein